MIEISVLPGRGDNPARFCEEFLAKLEELQIAKDVFFVVGVMHQLQNLGIVEELCQIDNQIVNCWWSLFDRGYRPENPADLEPIMTSGSDGLQPDQYRRFLRLYERYIQPDFFNSLKVN